MSKNNNTMKLYGVVSSGSTLMVRMALKALDIPYEMVMVDYFKGEHMTAEFAQKNPSKELPVLDDNGFFLSESIAIMQYLFDKYAPEGNEYYPMDAKKRAVVNHRMLFNACFYYRAISFYAMKPMFFDYPRTELGMKRVKLAMSTFETYLSMQKTKYACGSHVTLGDFCLISATIWLEGIGFDMSEWPMVSKWYENFKEEQPQFWELADEVMEWIMKFNKETPDMSQMNHPIHPMKR